MIIIGLFHVKIKTINDIFNLTTKHSITEPTDAISSPYIPVVISKHLLVHAECSVLMSLLLVLVFNPSVESLKPYIS